MKLIILFLALSALVSTIDICTNCLNSNCTFICTQQCQAFSFNSACAIQPQCRGNFCCPPTYYSYYSPDSMNYTYCVACNYTLPGCVTCTHDQHCTQCDTKYILNNGVCNNLNETSVGAGPYMEWIFIALIVLFAFFSLSNLLISALEAKRGAPVQTQENLIVDGSSTGRRETEMTKK